MESCRTFVLFVCQNNLSEERRKQQDKLTITIKQEKVTEVSGGVTAVGVKDIPVTIKVEPGLVSDALDVIDLD